MGEDFNDTRDNSEKRGGRLRAEGSFQMFRSFISNMQMAEVNFTGNAWTWANNSKEEDYVEARLDSLFHMFGCIIVQRP